MFDWLKCVKAGLSEYFSELRELFDVMAWTSKEFINDCSKEIARTLILLQFFGGVIGVIRTWSISLMFDAAALAKTTGDFNLGFVELLKSFAIFCFLGKIVGFINLRASQKRERLIGINSGYLDWKVTKMFLVDHSLSVHISEDTNLNEANVRKGHEYLSKIQSILLFQGIEAILALVLPLGALIILSVKIESHFLIFAPITLFLIFVAYSFYLARSIVKDAGPIDDEWRAYHRYRVERLREPERIKNNAKKAHQLN